MLDKEPIDLRQEKTRNEQNQRGPGPEVQDDDNAFWALSLKLREVRLNEGRTDNDRIVSAPDLRPADNNVHESTLSTDVVGGKGSACRLIVLADSTVAFRVSGSRPEGPNVRQRLERNTRGHHALTLGTPPNEGKTTQDLTSTSGDELRREDAQRGVRTVDDEEVDLLHEHEPTDPQNGDEDTALVLQEIRKAVKTRADEPVKSPSPDGGCSDTQMRLPTEDKVPRAETTLQQLSTTSLHTELAGREDGSTTEDNNVVAALDNPLKEGERTHDQLHLIPTSGDELRQEDAQPGTSIFDGDLQEATRSEKLESAQQLSPRSLDKDAAEEKQNGNLPSIVQLVLEDPEPGDKNRKEIEVRRESDAEAIQDHGRVRNAGAKPPDDDVSAGTGYQLEEPANNRTAANPKTTKLKHPRHPRGKSANIPTDTASEETVIQDRKDKRTSGSEIPVATGDQSNEDSSIGPKKDPKTTAGTQSCGENRIKSSSIVKTLVKLYLLLIYARVLLCTLRVPLVGALSLRQDQEPAATCTTDRAVFVGAPSAVSCHFHDDVRHLRLGFAIKRYDFDGVDPLADPVLSCIWQEKADAPECVEKKGYVLDKTSIGKAVTVNIPLTQRANAGRYLCENALSRATDRYECSLDVKGFNISCAPNKPKTFAGDSASLTCHYNSNLTRTKEDIYIYRFANTTSEPERVLDCKWDLRGRKDTPNCTVLPGYDLDTTFATRVTLGMKSVDTSQAGVFTCNAMPYNKDVHVLPCTLQVEEAPIPLRIAATKSTRNVSSPGLPVTPCQSEIRWLEGQPTFLACPLPAGVDCRTASITVTRVTEKPGDGAGSEELLHCNGGISTCNGTDGYSLLPTTQGAKIILEISTLIADHTGTYAFTFGSHLNLADQVTTCAIVKGVTGRESGAPASHQASCLEKVFLLVLLAYLCRRH